MMDEKENYQAIEDHPNYSVGDEKMEAIIKRYGEGTQVLFEIPDSEYGEINELVRAIRTIRHLLSLLGEKEKKAEELEKENIKFAKWVQINDSEKGEREVRAERLEEQLKQETVSVDELSLANQDLEKKVEELDILRCKTEEERDNLWIRIKSLEEGIEKHKLSKYYKHRVGVIDHWSDITDTIDQELYNLIKGGKDDTI